MLNTPDRSSLNYQTRVFLLLLTSLAGCALAPPESAAPSESAAPPVVHHPVVDIAVSQLGTPYRYGGSTPRGFDCSGLVYYSYRRVGVRLPRSTMAQYRHARPVALKNLQPGDLVFFKRTYRPVSHVGIYAGNARFIHAPSKGRVVSYDSLNDPYWRKRLVAAGRYGW
jgi:cell wall-associated NlpC family hydrolase